MPEPWDLSDPQERHLAAGLKRVALGVLDADPQTGRLTHA